MNHDENFCAEIQSTLPLYVGGDLEAQALAEVRLHLGDCPRCCERALSARAARRELVSALRLQSQHGPDLWSGVRAALAEEGVLRPLTPIAPPDHATHHATRSPRTPPPARPWWHASRTFAAAAAVVALLWIGARWSGALGSSETGTSETAPHFVADPGDARTPIGTREVAVDPTRAADLAQMPSGESPVAGLPADGGGGLRRLHPGERQLRESVPLLPIDRALLYSTPTREGSAMRPVVLHHVGANTPRW